MQPERGRPVTKRAWYALVALGLFFVAISLVQIVTGAEGGWSGFFLFAGCTINIISVTRPDWFSQQPYAAAALLDRFPEHAVIYANRRQYIALSIGGLGFVAAFVIEVMSEPAPVPPLSFIYWIGVPFFSLCSIVALAKALKPDAVRFSTDGLQITAMRGALSSSWTQVGPFVLASVPPSIPSIVVFNAATPETETMRKNRALMGHDFALPTTLAIPPAQLVEFANAWRDRALTRLVG